MPRSSRTSRVVRPGSTRSKSSRGSSSLAIRALSGRVSSPFIPPSLPRLLLERALADPVSSCGVAVRSGLYRQEVVDMRDDEIDDYLDFFESKIVSQGKAPSRRSCLSLTLEGRLASGRKQPGNAHVQ